MIEIDFLLVDGITQEVLVAVVETGKHSAPSQVDPPAAGIFGTGRRIAVHGKDAVTFNKNVPCDFPVVHGMKCCIVKQLFH